MYFINITKLKEDIIEKKFSEKDRFIYILLFIILNTIFMELNIFPNYEPNMIDHASSIMVIVITFLGTYFIYKANGGKEGNDFAGKYFSITWVRGIHLLLLLIPIFIIFSILDSYILELSPLNNEIATFVILSGFIFSVYFYAYKDVLEIRAKEV